MKVAIIAGSLALALGASTAQADIITGLYDTGVDDTGAVLSGGNGTTDTHYTVSTGDAAGQAVTYDNQYYLADSSTSRWISVDGNGGGAAGDPNGSGGTPDLTYDYQTTFDLTGFDPTTATISGLAGSDDTGLDILINGVSTGQTFTGFSSLTSFTISSGFVAGLNKIDFIVGDGDTPTAFRVEGLSGTADVPEPASWAMMIAGFGLIGAGMRRRAGRMIQAI